MTSNKKSIIRDINIEIVIDSEEHISQIKKYEKPEFNIDENIEYFKDLINSPPSSFTEIAKLIDVCIKFSLDKTKDK